MELLKQEQKYLELLKDKNLSPTDMCHYIGQLYHKATVEKDIDLVYVNWVKVGVALNNNFLIDAIFEAPSYSFFRGVSFIIPKTDKDIEDALQYAISHKNDINHKLIDRLVKHLVNEEYDYKHYVQRSEEKEVKLPFPLIPLPKEEQEIRPRFSHISHTKLNQIDYLIEKVKDIFKKPEDVKNRIAEMREKMTKAPENNEVSKPKQ